MKLCQEILIKQKYWRKEVAERIRETFPDSRILIVIIREQYYMYDCSMV